MQQSCNTEEGKFCFFDAVDLRINRIPLSGGKVGAFEDGVVEYGLGEVAVVEQASRKIGLGKVSFLKLAVPEYGLFDASFVKGRMAEYTAVKGKRKPEVVAGVEPQSQHLAVPELYIAQYGSVQLHKAQVAVDESAVYELKARKVAIRKIALAERAAFVFASG